MAVAPGDADARALAAGFDGRGRPEMLAPLPERKWGLEGVDDVDFGLRAVVRWVVGEDENIPGDAVHNHCLLDVGDEKVEDKEKELILDAMGLSPPLEKERTAKGHEKNRGGNERYKAEDNYCLEAFADGLRQWGKRGRLYRQCG
ncbi:hypothetical protein SLS56_002272 [Neofusicoccum ribis]|uniref:Uncharacterized protein n=1 Tax=Neofusicoccum ribis TaxID=45134 RepID=A0ABR3T4R5_9PEZI